LPKEIKAAEKALKGNPRGSYYFTGCGILLSNAALMMKKPVFLCRETPT
jgi:hypothetical protein